VIPFVIPLGRRKGEPQALFDGQLRLL
jgi:hypothetical protein